MKVTLKDGSVKEYDKSMSVYDIALDLSEGLARAACAGEIDGEVVDIRTVVDKDCQLNILTMKDEKALPVLRHTASHVMAQAVKRLYPGVKLAIGPSISDGFYYDMEFETPLTSDDFGKIEAEMKKIIKENLEIVRFTKPRAEAIAFMQEKGEPYKVELIQDLPEDSEISFYQQGEFVDLCAGPHLKSTKDVGKAFKIMSLAGAYWRGDEHNKMLTRLYATAFPKKEELEAYITMMEEAKKRDHKIYINDIAINKVDLIKLSDFSDVQAHLMMLKHKELLDIAKKQNNSNEVLFIEDLDFESEVRILGDEFVVSPSKNPFAVSVIAHAKRKSLVYLHNHPSTNTFSIGDIDTFVSERAIKTMSVVTNQGEVYIINKLDNYSFEGAVKLLKDIYNTYPAGEIDDKDFVKNFLKRCREGGIEYAKAK